MLSELFDQPNRNYVLVGFGGFLFAIAWWIFFDIVAVHGDICKDDIVVIFPGVCSTCAMIAVLLLPYHVSVDDLGYNTEKCSPITLLIALYFAFVVVFGALIWSICIWIEHFLTADMPQWPGLGIVIQNVLILLTTLILKFGRNRMDNY